LQLLFAIIFKILTAVKFQELKKADGNHLLMITLIKLLAEIKFNYYIKIPARVAER